MHTRHLNGDRTDNRLENLVYGTPEENEKDKELHGTNLAGERHPRAKLTASEVLDIKNSRRSGRELAQHYGIVLRTVEKIKGDERWKHLT